MLQKKNNEEKSQLFQYKQKFDLSYAQYGIVKPMMGGSGFKDKVKTNALKNSQLYVYVKHTISTFVWS